MSPNDERRPRQEAPPTNIRRSEVSSLPHRNVSSFSLIKSSRKTPLQESLDAIGDALGDARDELTPDEHSVFLAIVIIMVAGEAARGVNSEWRAAA